MGNLRFQIMMTLDGFVAGPDQSVASPLGEGGSRIHDWAYGLKAFREMQGDRSGGETGINDEVLGAAFENVGATIMGRNMFGGGPGPWSEDPWTGWWGEDPPFHTPVFALTHHAREPLAMQGGTTFFFVAEGIEAALRRAREAARGQDVMLGGGAGAAQQYLAAGLVDEMELDLVPLLLGGGVRLFDNLAGSDPTLELVRTIATPDVTHLKYRVTSRERR